MEVPGVTWTFHAGVYPRYSYFRDRLIRLFPRFQEIIEKEQLQETICQGEERFKEIQTYTEYLNGPLGITVFYDPSVDKSDLQGLTLKHFVVNCDVLKYKKPEIVGTTREKIINEGQTTTQFHPQIIVLCVGNSNVSYDLDVQALSEVQKQNLIIFDVGTKQCKRFMDGSLISKELNVQDLTTASEIQPLGKLIQEVLEAKPVEIIEDIADYCRRFELHDGQTQSRSLIDKVNHELSQYLYDQYVRMELGGIEEQKSPQHSIIGIENPQSQQQSTGKSVVRRQDTSMEPLVVGDKLNLRFLIILYRQLSIVREKKKEEKEKNPDFDDRRVTRILYNLWANLSSQEKEVFTDLAKQINPDYEWHNQEKAVTSQKPEPTPLFFNAKVMRKEIEGSIVPFKPAGFPLSRGDGMMLKTASQTHEFLKAWNVRGDASLGKLMTFVVQFRKKEVEQDLKLIINFKLPENKDELLVIYKQLEQQPKLTAISINPDLDPKEQGQEYMDVSGTQEKDLPMPLKKKIKLPDTNSSCEDEKSFDRYTKALSRRTKCLICGYLSDLYGLPQAFIAFFLSESGFDIENKCLKQLKINSLKHWNDFDPTKKSPKQKSKFFREIVVSSFQELLTQTEDFVKAKLEEVNSLNKLQFEIRALLRQTNIKLKVLGEKDLAPSPKLPLLLQTELLRLKNVNGCGTIFGKLTLHTFEELTAEEKKKVEGILDLHGYCHGYSIELIEPKEENMRFEPGTKLEGEKKSDGKGISGSLGCFINIKNNLDDAKSLYAVTCAHNFIDCFPQIQAEVREQDERKLYQFGEADPTLACEDGEKVDIQAIKVNKDMIDLCDTSIKSPEQGESGIPSPSCFYEDSDELADQEVFKRGAITGLTYGIVASSNFRKEVMAEYTEFSADYNIIVEDNRKAIKHMWAARKTLFDDNLPEFVRQVNPVELLRNLPCLSLESREEVQDDFQVLQNIHDRSMAMQKIYEKIVRRPYGWEQLIEGFRRLDKGHLADILDSVEQVPRFCSKGDSGSVVCRQMPNGSIELVSMLKNRLLHKDEQYPKFYNTCHLKRSLDRITKKNQSIELVTSSDGVASNDIADLSPFSQLSISKPGSTHQNGYKL